jgi:hypothetical protein
MQTVVIRKPKVHADLYGMELCPVNPFPDHKATRIKKADGTIITWDFTGTTAVYPDGSTKKWWVKPTMNVALKVDNRWTGYSTFFQFFADKSVHAFWFGHNYYWSEPKYAEPELGELVDEPHHCTYLGGWTYNDKCFGYCIELEKEQEYEYEYEYKHNDDACKYADYSDHEY